MDFLVIANYALILFSIALPFIFSHLIKNYPNYKFDYHYISDLGTRDCSKWKLFSLTTIVYFILSLILPYTFITYYGDSKTAIYSTLVMSFCYFFGIFIGVFPGDVKRISHRISAYLSFLFIVLVSVIFIFIPFYVDGISRIVSLISLGLLGTSIVFFYKGIKIFTDKSGKSENEFGVTIFEWMIFVELVVLNLFLAVGFVWR